MKRILKKSARFLGVVLVGLISLLGLFALYQFFVYDHANQQLLDAFHKEPTVLMEQGRSIRDLNKNGKVDVYEDARFPVDMRVEDLLKQMTLEEKAGTMFVSMAGIGKHGSLFTMPSPLDPQTMVLSSNIHQLLGKHITSVNIQVADAKDIAVWNNNLQQLASRSRLGIPITIASDPRHAFSFNPLAGFGTEGFSSWPEPIGFGALGDTAVVREFAAIAAREYRAVGIRLALHPMADLATEPRWPRINGTFGEDAYLAAGLVGAYIRGFQGDTIGSESVACVTKHFAGGGPQLKGWDPHFAFGKEQVYPGNNLAYHLIPFRSAIAAGTAGMMPYYSIPINQTSENVGFAFNKEMITGLLKDSLGFQGIVCSDWSIITEKKIFGIKVFDPAGWGVEALSPQEKIRKAIDAGIDQFGGEEVPELIVSLVKAGQVSEERINASARKILSLKFRLGLFENPFVDIEALHTSIGTTAFVRSGQQMQARVMTLLKNENGLLPLNRDLRIYSEGIPEHELKVFGSPVNDPGDADVAILRLSTPFLAHGDNMMSAFFHHDDLDFKEPLKTHILDICKKKPTIIVIYMDRPAVFPEIFKAAAAVVVDYGAEHEVVMKVLTGQMLPEGKLPFELPSSMQSVERQKEDLPSDAEKPLLPRGYHLPMTSARRPG